MTLKSLIGEISFYRKINKNKLADRLTESFLKIATDGFSSKYVDQLGKSTLYNAQRIGQEELMNIPQCAQINAARPGILNSVNDLIQQYGYQEAANQYAKQYPSEENLLNPNSQFYPCIKAITDLISKNKQAVQ